MRGGIPSLVFAVVLLAGACDFQLLEPLEVPRWGVSLTIPLINKSYPLIDMVDSSTIFHDTTSQELRIEFRDGLDTTKIDPNFLEIQLPAKAIPDPINESVDAPDAAAFFSTVVESVVVSIALDALLNLTGEPAFAGLSFPQGTDFTISQTIWNTIVAVPPISPISLIFTPIQIIDTTALLAGNNIIKRIRYVQLSADVGVNKLTARVTNDDFPTAVESIDLEIVSGPLNVTYSRPKLFPGTSAYDSTDLASQKVGTSLSLGYHMQFPAATGPVTIAAFTDPKIDISILFQVSGVDSVGITTTNTLLVPTKLDPLPLSDVGNIRITSGILRTGEPDPINTISLTNLRNTLPFDIRFELTFPNISSYPNGGDSLRFGPFTLSAGQATINQTTDLGGYLFHNPADTSAIDSFEYQVVAEVMEQDVALPLDGNPIGAFQATFGVGDLYFDSIKGNFSLEFPTVPTTIANIPTGFAGFKFDRLNLTLRLHNEIDLPMELQLFVRGSTVEGNTAEINIDAPINYPSASVLNDNTAHTIIVLDQNDVRTYWVGEGGAFDSTIVTNNGQSIVEVMNLPPDTLSVGGSTIINGSGEVAAGKGIWGEFEMIAPLALILPHEVTFLPVNPIEWTPLDEGTRTQIKKAITSASITSRVTTHFPIGGNLSLLISDTTLFTLALDALDDIAAGIHTAARSGDTTIYTSLEAVLAADFIYEIDHILFYPEQSTAVGSLSPTETTAKRVEFFPFGGGDPFWIGRLFEMELPSPTAWNLLGHVTTGGDTTQVIAMDAEQVEWIASDQTLYMKPLITFHKTPDVRTIQATNTIDFTAFMSFNLTSDIIVEAEPPDTAGVERISVIATIPNDTVAVGKTDTTGLDAVFAHPTKDVKDLDLTATSSHTGVVTTPVIRPDVNNSALPFAAWTKRVLLVTGVSSGTAKITVSADDPDDELDPVETSFLVTVVPL